MASTRTPQGLGVLPTGSLYLNRTSALEQKVGHSPVAKETQVGSSPGDTSKFCSLSGLMIFPHMVGKEGGDFLPLLALKSN